MTDVPADQEPASPARSHLLEIAWVFTKLGFTAFGGPMAHLALMEDELVNRRKWCDRRRFMDANAAVNFIPGPNSTELAIHLGFLRGGFPGLIVAGVCFITPAVLIILPIAFLYVRYGTMPRVAPVLHSISAAIVAVIAVACVRLARQALRDPLTVGVAMTTFLLLVLGAMRVNPMARLFAQVQPEIFLLALAAGAGVIWNAGRNTGMRAAVLLPLAQTNPAETFATTFDSRWIEMLWFFFKIGATLFGSGYVLVSFLQSGLVDQYHWISVNELNDAIAVGQFTPGPLLTTATFIGYLLGSSKFGYGDAGGVLGAILATLAIFLPSFLLIALLAPLLDRLRHSAPARAALDAMNAAVVAMIGMTLLRLGAEAFTSPAGNIDPLNIAIALIAILLMLWKQLNATWLVLSALLAGVARAWF